MINLLSPDTKQNIRAARTNVKLRRYTFLCALAAIAVFIIYAGGFYLILADKATADQQLSSDKSNTSAFQPILERAKTYKANLVVAKKVLSTGMSYSSFIIGTAQALPKSSVLTNLSLTNLGIESTSSKSPNTNTLTLQARSKSYGAGLMLKESLEKSDLFENVNISTIAKSDPGEGATNIEIEYPYIVSINVTITKQKTVI